jgi:NADH-quinone oxidoreductase subunit N
VSIPSAATAVVVAVTATLTVLLGVLPGPLLELAQQASEFVR